MIVGRNGLAPLIECGVDGLALELAEPTVFGGSGKPETMPDYAEQYERNA